MNDSSLRRVLHEWKIPASTAGARDRAKHRALIALQKHEVQRSAPDAFPAWRLTLVPAVVFLCAITAIALFRAPVPRENLANDQQLLQQIESLFPRQLNAVIQKDGQTVLSMCDKDALGADQPVLLLFKRRDQLIRVLSFSGHRVCVSLGQHDACFDVLETTDGGVILAGDRDILVASHHPILDGYSVRAQRLSL